MGLMDMLSAAQGGSFFANAGRVAGLNAGAAQAAITALAPAIATQLRKRAEDEDAFEALLDLLEDGDGDAFLDNASLVDDPEVRSDGKAILKDIYGTQAAALKAGGELTGLTKPTVEKLMPICAASVLAALARANGSGAQQLAGSTEGGGLLGSVVSAVVEGAMKGVQSSLAPKRRRRRYTSYLGARKRKRTTRRKRKPSLESIFRDILSGI